MGGSLLVFAFALAATMLENVWNYNGAPRDQKVSYGSIASPLPTAHGLAGITRQGPRAEGRRGNAAGHGPQAAQ